MRKFYLILTILIILFGCKTSNNTGPSTSRQADLSLTNNLSGTVDLTIQDGSPDTIFVTLVPNEVFNHTWEEYDPPFTDNDGFLIIRYYFESPEEKEIHLRLNIGRTLYYNLNTISASFTIFNSSYNNVHFSLDDGSEDSNVSHNLSPDEDYIKTWQNLDPFFLEHGGFLTLTYSDANGSQKEKHFQLDIGDNLYYELNNSDYLLKVTNSTQALVWFNLDDHETYYLLSYEELKFYPSFFSQFQTLINYSGDHVFSNSRNIFLSDLIPTSFSINPTGGAIEIKNNSFDITIEKIYISPTSSDVWGSNDLNGYLYPTESALWTVEDGTWDIRIEDEENGYELYDSQVNMDQTIELYFPQDFSPTKHSRKQTIFLPNKHVEFKRIFKN